MRLFKQCFKPGLKLNFRFFGTALFFLAAVAGEGAAFSQSTVIDSLEKLLINEKEDSSRIELLLQLSKNYDNVDTAKARNYYREADAIALKSGNEVLLGFTNEIAGVLQTRYDHKKAMQYYNTALNLLTRHQQSLRVKRSIASLNNNLGIIHYMNGDLEGALRFFMGAVKFYEENDPKNFNLGYGYGNISTTYADLKKTDNAVIYSKKAIEFAEKANNKNLVMSASISHGSNLLKLKRYDESMPYLQRAKLIAEELKNKYNLYLFYYNIAEYHYNITDYKKALDNYEKALHFAREMDSPHEIGFMLCGIGNCYIYLKNYPAAGKNLEKAKKLSEDNQLKDLEQYIYQSLAELSEKAGDYKNALLHKNRFISLKDSAYSADNIKRIEFLDAQYQAEKKEKEIMGLQNEKQIQALTIRQKSTLNYILVASVIVMLSVGLLLYRNFRHRQLLAKQRDELQQQQIRELEKDKQLIAVDSLLKGQEEERSRLAKDLHDGLGGLLSGVKFSLSNMKDNLIVTPDNMAVFERSLDMIDTSIKELRRVAHNMMPEMLTKFGLDEALKDYCNTVNATKLLAVKYQSLGMETRFDKANEIIVYRIVQELLNNILKHAEASEVFVQLIRQDDRLNIVVEDNGKGFDTAILEKSKGAGWVNIRSRVEYLKGQLDVHSEPGKGTLINMEFNV